MRVDVEQPPTMIRCTCPRHPGGTTYEMVTDFVAEHQGVDNPRDLRESDLSIVWPLPGSADKCIQYADEANTVLVTVWPEDGEVEVAQRRSRWESWGPPMLLNEVER